MVVVQVSNRNVLEQKAQVNVWQQIGATEPSAAAQQLMKQNDNFGYKSRTQMLAQGQPQVPTYLSAPRPRPPRPPHTHTHTHTNTPHERPKLHDQEIGRGREMSARCISIPSVIDARCAVTVVRECADEREERVDANV